MKGNMKCPKCNSLKITGGFGIDPATPELEPTFLLCCRDCNHVWKDDSRPEINYRGMIGGTRSGMTQAGAYEILETLRSSR